MQRERDQLQKELDEYKSCKVKESADDSRKKPAPDLFSSTVSDHLFTLLVACSHPLIWYKTGLLDFMQTQFTAVQNATIIAYMIQGLALG